MLPHVLVDENRRVIIGIIFPHLCTPSSNAMEESKFGHVGGVGGHDSLKSAFETLSS